MIQSGAFMHALERVQEGNVKPLRVATAGLAGLALILSACVSIPPEAPELSAELGKRISAIEAANVTLLHRYFDRKREDIDEFIEEEWLPEFAKNFFSDPAIADVWNTIVRENDKKQRLMFLMKTGPKLQAEVNKARVRLIQPLDDLERRIEQKLRDEYAQARAINNSLTSFLLSASEVAENRNRYLGLTAVSDEAIGNIIDKTDKAVSDLIEKTGDPSDRPAAVEKFVNSVHEIIEKI